MIDNKWKHGKVTFELPPLPPRMLGAIGVKPISVVLDRDIGRETVLLITESREYAEAFDGQDIATFRLNSGLAKTSYGLVHWLLFYFSSPVTKQQTTYECVVNPTDAIYLDLLLRLADQQYWHVVVANEEGRVANLFEFANTYHLSDDLHLIAQASPQIAVTDFAAAKAEFQATYGVEDLLTM